MSVGGITGTTRLEELSNLDLVLGLMGSPLYSSTTWLISLDIPSTPRSMKYSTYCTSLSLILRTSSLWLSMSALSRMLSPQQ
ncbi:hypothetical protein X975_14063, partial [Stegodyphus mimosarum]